MRLIRIYICNLMIINIFVIYLIGWEWFFSFFHKKYGIKNIRFESSSYICCLKDNLITLSIYKVIYNFVYIYLQAFVVKSVL